MCGCTENHACEGGCTWADREQTFCSQCIGYILLKDPKRFDGIFAYDLLPVRTPRPISLWCAPLKQRIPSYLVDLRRLDEATIERMAHLVAPRHGATVEEVLDSLKTSGQFPIDARCVGVSLAAKSLEAAAAMLEEIRTTGQVKGARAELTICVAACGQPANTGGRY